MKDKLHATAAQFEVGTGRTYDANFRSSPIIHVKAQIALPCVEGKRQPPSIAALRSLMLTLSVSDARALRDALNHELTSDDLKEMST